MKIFELEIAKLKYSDFFDEITGFLQKGTSLNSLLQGETKQQQDNSKIIFTPNPEICLATLEDKKFLKALRQADYLTSDGIGLYLAYQLNETLQPHFSGKDKGENERSDYLEVKATQKIEGVWVSRIYCALLLPYYFFNILFRKNFLYKKYGDRICGSDLTRDLVNFAEKNNIHIAVLDPYFPNDQKKCETQKYFLKNMKEKFPNLKLDFYIYREKDKTHIFEKIKHSDVQILFSTLGMKRQEYAVIEIMNYCTNLKLGLGVGSSFDYFTGFQKRAPKIWRDLGFEWLYRIFTSPGKIKRLKRIFQAVIIFPIKIISYKK